MGSVTETAAPERNSGQEEMVTIGLTKTHCLALMARVSDWRREEGAGCHAARVDDGVKGRVVDGEMTKNIRLRAALRPGAAERLIKSCHLSAAQPTDRRRNL